MDRDVWRKEVSHGVCQSLVLAYGRALIAGLYDNVEGNGMPEQVYKTSMFYWLGLCGEGLEKREGFDCLLMT